MRHRLTTVLSFAFAGTAATLLAQGAGSITGTVKDSSGAPCPGRR